MADRIIKILEAADTYDLLSLDELKIAFNVPLTDTSLDAEMAQAITRFSDVVATTCNRVFAKETVAETWRCLGSRRVFLSHFPALETDIQSVECPRGTLIDPSDWEFEEKSGKLELFGSRAEPIVVTYIGGYDLPDEAPPALKQATELMIRGNKAVIARLLTGNARSISHKDARVMYFDPLSSLNNTNQGVLATSAANTLLMHYTRLEC
jgi:hypothetical protein